MLIQCRTLSGYDSGYISGVLAMNAFKEQFGGRYLKYLYPYIADVL